ncbi:uncharacterized protein CCOS01_13582, partial [Colletotrichum costaricense]
CASWGYVPVTYPSVPRDWLLSVPRPPKSCWPAGGWCASSLPTYLSRLSLTLPQPVSLHPQERCSSSAGSTHAPVPDRNSPYLCRPQVAPSSAEGERRRAPGCISAIQTTISKSPIFLPSCLASTLAFQRLATKAQFASNPSPPKRGSLFSFAYFMPVIPTASFNSKLETIPPLPLAPKPCDGTIESRPPTSLPSPTRSLFFDYSFKYTRDFSASCF